MALAVVITLAVMALGVVAGKWQYGRHVFRSEAIHAHEAAQALPTADIATLLGPADAATGDAQWRHVSATGHFDPDSLTALRSRSVDGTASLQYLAWFLTDAGAVLVNTGWVPRTDADVPILPSGDLTIGGVMREQEEDDGRRGEGATRITAAQMPPASADALPGWIMLREPCVPEGCLDTALQPVPEPQLGLGPHLSYAYQWWLLTVIAPVAAVLILRRDAQHERAALSTLEASNGGAPPPRSNEPKTPRRRRLRDTTDEDYEDAL